MTGIDVTTDTPAVDRGLVEPGSNGGLLEVVRHRYLLRLLVRKDLKVRYQGSVLGLAWSYIKPAVQFCVYFFVIGMVLGLRDHMDYFAIYLFSGLVLITFFNESFNSATRSVVRNRSLIKKIYLPREMFPVASMLVSCVHFLPGLVILMGAALILGWVPTPVTLGAALLGFAIIAVFGMGVGFIFAAFNVFFRDFEKVVDVVTIVTRWSAPMIYPWTFVRDAFNGGIGLEIYLANPLAGAVTLFQRAFWLPVTDGTFEFPPHLFVRGLIIFAAVVMLFVLAQWVFGRMERRFAAEL